MRTILLAGGLVLAAALAAAATAATAQSDPVIGTWQTAKDDNGNFGHIEVSACGATICGVLVRAFDASGAEVQSEEVGRRIIWNMVPQGGGAYAKGKIYAPDRDRTYNSRMTLSGNVLAVQGCVLGICRDGGKWQRVK